MWLEKTLDILLLLIHTLFYSVTLYNTCTSQETLRRWCMSILSTRLLFWGLNHKLICSYTVMDRSLGHPHSMGQGAFLASTTADVPLFWAEHISNNALNLHRKSHKITSKGSWVIWERVYFGAQNNFLDSFPRLLCIAGGINLIFKCRIQWKALDTLNICKNFGGNRARFHEYMEEIVKSSLRKPPWRPKFGNCIPSL